MKEQKKYSRSFAKRLTWRIMIMLFIVMTIVSLIFLGIAILLVSLQVDLLTSPMLTNKCMSIESTLTEVYTAGVNTVPDIENNLKHPDRMKDIMRRIVELNPDIRSCGISFRENYYPKEGRWYCPYAIRKDSDSIDVMKTIGGLDQDYLTADWFTEALKAKEGYWSKPFFDKMDEQTPLVTFLMPIRDQRDSTVAVLGIDISLDKLFYSEQNLEKYKREKDKAWNPKYEIYSFVIDSSGTYLKHPDHKRVINENYYDYARNTPDKQDDKLGKAMTSGKKGDTLDDPDEEDMVVEGEEVLVCYQPIKHTPWSMALVIPTIFINIFGYLLGGFFLFFILIGLIVVFFAGRRGIKKVTMPLKQLAASTNDVAKGNFDTPLPLIKSNDEVHLLRDSFENMQHSLRQYVEELKTTTAQRASIESELKIAHEIQMSMLPKTFPPYPERHDIEIYGSLVPAKAIGGDLFDIFVRDEKLFFCIGDVSGKGVPASLVMAVTRTLFRNISTHMIKPNAIVSAINKALTESNDTMMFVTFFAGILDLSTGQLYYCNGGHNEPLLIDGEVSFLPCDPNVPLGVTSDWEFTLQEIHLNHQATLLLFTDGVNEAEDCDHQQFGDERIVRQAQQLLAEGIHNPKDIIDSMTKAIHQHVGTAEQNDDQTMLAITYFSDAKIK